MQDNEKILKESTSKMPEPNPEAVSAEDQRETGYARDRENQRLRDSEGRTFDPTIHQTNPDGTPKKTLAGKLKIKRGKSRRSLERRAARGREWRQIESSYRAAAEASTGIWVQTGCNIFGEIWKPRKTKNYDEGEYLTMAFENYYRAKDVRDFPPGVALSIALLSYSMSRFQREEARPTVERIKKNLRAVGSKLAGIFKRLKKRSKNAHDHRRDNGDGENDTSEKTGVAVSTFGDAGDSSGPSQS